MFAVHAHSGTRLPISFLLGVHVLDAAKEEEAYLILLTGILTGMRRAEVFALRWEDVNWKEDVIHVRQTLYWRHGRYVKPEDGEAFMFVPPKSKTSTRDIDLSPALKAELRQRYLASQKIGLVFCQPNGKPINPSDFLKRRFARAVKAAQLGKLRFHDLRHTYGSMKLEQGENIYYVQRQMGHSSVQITIDIYGHLLETRKPQAAARTDELLFGTAAVRAE